MSVVMRSESMVGHWDLSRSGDRHSEGLSFVNGGVGFRIAFQDINTLPVFETDSTQTIYENTSLLEISATDANGNDLVYSISELTNRSFPFNQNLVN